MININTLKIKLLMIIIFFILIISGCVKEGPIGPQGPSGPSGPQGPQGIQGNSGTLSYSYTIPLNSFSYLSSTSEWWISQELGTYIESTDAVLGYVYANHAGSSEYMALPMLSYWNTGECFNAFNYSITNSNRVRLSIRNSCGTNPYSNMATGAISYRFFVIKGQGRIILDSLETNNYIAVSHVLGFEE